MALTAKQKLQAFRSQAGGGTKRLSAQDKLRRFRASTAEQDEERGFLSRLYYGEEEGEGGAMGLEEIPGQFKDVLFSPIEKGVKPLVSLGTGVAKLAVGTDEDEDTRLARQVGEEFVESVVDLPEDIVSGYPTEGIMNLASAIALPFTGGASAAGALSKIPKLGSLAKVGERLGRVGRTKGIQVADVVADPMIGVPSKAVDYLRPKVVDYLQQRRAKKTKVKPKSTRGKFKKLTEEMAPPGRTKRSIIADFVQSFLTSIPDNAVRELYKHVGDPQKYKIMLAAADKPKRALKAVHERLRASIGQIQKNASKKYGAARYDFFHGKPKTEGAIPNVQETISTDLRDNATLPYRINQVLNEAMSGGEEGFGARIVVKFYDEAEGGSRIYEGLDAAGEGVQTIRELNNETVGALRTLPGQKYEYDVEFVSPQGTASPLSDTERATVRNHIRKNLLPSDFNDNPSLPIEDLINKDFRFVQENPLKERDARVRDALVGRLHSATTGAVQQHLEDVGKKADADAFRQIRQEYRDSQERLDQVRATYGNDIEKGVVTNASSDRLAKQMETEEGVKDLERLVSKTGIQQILGAMSSRSFGTGLVVKADLSKKLTAAGTLLGGGILAGGLPGTGLTVLAGVPLLAAYSPRAMLAISNRIANSPAFMRALGRGPQAQQEAQRQARAYIRYARQAREILGNDTVQDLAKTGMTLGQFIERLQEEEKGQR